MTHGHAVSVHDPTAVALQELPALLGRARADYREMPGLMLTRAQMQRLWAIDALLCDALIERLVSGHIVRRVRTDLYIAFGSPA